MTKPSSVHPRTFEWVCGMAVVVIVAGVTLSRSGPRSVSADSASMAEHVEVRSAFVSDAKASSTDAATERNADVTISTTSQK